jgi:hypothetical protein
VPITAESSSWDRHSAGTGRVVRDGEGIGRLFSKDILELAMFDPCTRAEFEPGINP